MTGWNSPPCSLPPNFPKKSIFLNLSEIHRNVEGTRIYHLFTFLNDTKNNLKTFNMIENKNEEKL